MKQGSRLYTYMVCVLAGLALLPMVLIVLYFLYMLFIAWGMSHQTH